jgi:hypothetical protein
MKARSVFLLSGFVVSVVSACGVALADQSGTGDEAAAESNEKPTNRQDDDRLPPVLPGEEVVTETGQKMRVWSSAGPVPRNLQPTPQTIYGNGYGGPDVIVDGRGFRGR